MAVTPDLTGIIVFRIPVSFLISQLVLSPSPSQSYESRPRLAENYNHQITRPVFLGCLPAFEPIDKSTQKHLLRRMLVRTRFLHFSSPPRCPSLAIPETQEVPEFVSLRCFSSLPLLRRTSVDTESRNRRRNRHTNEKRTSSSARSNAGQLRTREEGRRNAQRDSVRVYGGQYINSVSVLGRLSQRVPHRWISPRRQDPRLPRTPRDFPTKACTNIIEFGAK